METITEPAPAETNQSIEKGVFIQPYIKTVHACKVREDIGAGITRCGIPFMMGDFKYKPAYQYGVPENAGADGTWKRCAKCEAATDYEKFRKTWGWWKGTVKRTWKLIAQI